MHRSIKIQSSNQAKRLIQYLTKVKANEKFEKIVSFPKFAKLNCRETDYTRSPMAEQFLKVDTVSVEGGPHRRITLFDRGV